VSYLIQIWEATRLNVIACRALYPNAPTPKALVHEYTSAYE
jgi:hypothetical protein